MSARSTCSTSAVVVCGANGRPQPRPACRYTDVDLAVCQKTIKSGSRMVARAPRGIGHWVWAARAPRGDAILAQWSAECEVPVAYRIVHRVLHSFGSGTVALGWLGNGDALVHFPAPGGCGRGYVPGIYAVTPAGKRRLILRTQPRAGYLMWGP